MLCGILCGSRHARDTLSGSALLPLQECLRDSVMSTDTAGHSVGVSACSAKTPGGILWLLWGGWAQGTLHGILWTFSLEEETKATKNPVEEKIQEPLTWKKQPP